MEMQDRFVTRTSAQEAIDVGLREHMLRVYNYMASGLALSGIVAYLIANTGVKSVFFTTAANGQVGLTLIGILGILAPLATARAVRPARPQQSLSVELVRGLLRFS